MKWGQGEAEEDNNEKDGGQDSPLEVHCGNIEDHSFKPQDHEEPLREGAVPDALSITSSLKQTDNKLE